MASSTAPVAVPQGSRAGMTVRFWYAVVEIPADCPKEVPNPPRHRDGHIQSLPQDGVSAPQMRPGQATTAARSGTVGSTTSPTAATPIAATQPPKKSWRKYMSKYVGRATDTTIGACTGFGKSLKASITRHNHSESTSASQGTFASGQVFMQTYSQRSAFRSLDVPLETGLQ